MKLRTKLLWKTLAILIPIELTFFFAGSLIATYFNDFAGRSFVGLSFLLIPIFGSYFLMMKKLDEQEELVYKLYLEEQKEKKK